MNCDCSFTCDELLTMAIRTLERLAAGTQFIVQDLLPPAIWRTLPLDPTRLNLGKAFSKEMKKHSNVCVFGKTENDQAVYMKTNPSGQNSDV